MITAIENMDERILNRSSLDKILNFLTKKSEMIDRMGKFVKENPDVELIPDSPEEFLNDLSGFTKDRPVEKINLWKFRQARNVSFLKTLLTFRTAMQLSEGSVSR